MAIYVYDKNGNQRAWAGPEDDATLSKMGLSKTKSTTRTSSNANSPKPKTGTGGIGYEMDAKGWYVTPEGKHLNPEYYDAYGNRLDSSSYGNSDIMDEIERQRKARIASRKAALGGLKSKTLSSLALEKTGVKSSYYDAKNDESSSAQLRAKKIAEIMSAKGYSEGAQSQNELVSNNALQSNLGLLNRQELTAYDDIAKRETDAETAYQEGLAQARADADTAAAEQRLAELGTERDYGRQDEQTAKEDERYKDELDYNRGQQEREDFIKNLSIYSYPDIQAEINRIMNNNDNSDDWKLEPLRNIRAEKINKQLDDEIKTIGQYSGNIQAEITRREKSSDPLDNALIPYLKAVLTEQQANPSDQYKRMWDLFVKIGIVSTKEMADILGIPVGTTTIDYLQTKYNINKPYPGGGSGGNSGGGGSDPLEEAGLIN